MAPHSLDSALVEKYTQESYEETVRKICEPRPPRGKEDEKELEDFIDSKMEKASKSLEVAAALFAAGGLAFPPAAFVGVALGIGAAVVRYFDSQNKMKALLEKLTDKIYDVRKMMNSGFDDLEELITKNDFLSEVVSPSNELFTAYMRYVKNPSKANRQEFIECCEIRSSGGVHIIRTAITKIDRYTEANFIKKSQIARHYVHKEYVNAVFYLYKSLLDVMIAHTLYYTIMTEDEREIQMKEDGVVNLMNEVEGKLQGIHDWRKETYFNHDNLEPIIRHITGYVNNNGNPTEDVILWLKNNYPADDFKEKYVAVVWTPHSSRLYEEHLSTNKPEHTIKFTGLKNKNGKKKTLLLHRMTESSTQNVNKQARRNLGWKIAKQLRDRDIENAWAAIGTPPNEGFSLVLYFAVGEVVPQTQAWDCKYFHSNGAGDDYFATTVNVAGGLFTNKRYYCMFYKL